MVKPPAEGLS